MDGPLDPGLGRRLADASRRPEDKGAGGVGCGAAGGVPGARAVVPGAPTNDLLGRWGPTPPVRVRLGLCFGVRLGCGWVRVGLGVILFNIK